MPSQTSRSFFILFVLSLSTVLTVFTLGHLLKDFCHVFRKVGGLSEHLNEPLTQLPAVSTTALARSDVSLKTNVVTRGKMGQVETSAHGAAAETPMPVLFKSSFKSSPRWTFDNVYNQDAPSRQTTCAQSLRNSHHASFKKSFLSNIRLFLHKDSINMSEWNRLSHYNNPFGFMEYNYSDVMNAVKLIPKPQEPLLLPKPGSDGCVRCAVVGASGILNGSKMGTEIDSHDYVFRMNGAVIAGYEADVGEKTSVYVHTAHSITASLKYFKSYGYTSVPNDEGIIYVLIPEGVCDFTWLQALIRGERVTTGRHKNREPRSFYAGRYNESRFYVLHQDFLRYVRDRFLLSPHLNDSHWALVRPTNGAFTLFLALHTCDTVNAYGFITEDYEKYPNYYVERTVKTPVIMFRNHDYILEMKTWQKLHQSKIIKLYQRTDQETKVGQPKSQ